MSHHPSDLQNLEFKSIEEFEELVKPGLVYYEVNIGGVYAPKEVSSEIRTQLLAGSIVKCFDYKTETHPSERKEFLGDIQNTSWKAVFTDKDLAEKFYQNLSEEAKEDCKRHLDQCALYDEELDAYDDYWPEDPYYEFIERT